ncbi:MAG: Zn-dependent oligopeptidase [Flavobacteriaceae bacterium]|nr:Zn-dependent oligopeptidase [Flavobacteriaceae bacterium]
MKLFQIALIAILISNCNSENKTLTMSETNPFNTVLNEPIDYVNVTGTHIDEYINVSISNAKQEVAIINQQQVVTFENTFIALDRVLNNIGKASNNAFTMFWTSTDSIARAKGLEGYEKITPLFTDLFSDKNLFNQFKKFSESDDYKKLTGHRKVLVDDVLKSFEESGVNLNKDDLKKYKKLNEEVNELTSQYSTNMNTANLVVKTDEDGMLGLPDTFKNKYKIGDDLYEIPVINATNGTVMKNAKSEAIRKEFAVKYDNRGADKNLVILDSLVSKRYQIGRIMGYKSYAAYNVNSKMAKTPETVWSFINDLIELSKEKAIADHKILKAERNKELNIQSDAPINPWDINFYNNQILKNKYKVDGELIREYLPMDACLEGMFKIYQQLLGLEFKKVKNASVWNDDVTMYQVFEGDTLKGVFYLDLYPRPNKESWFYGVGLTEGSQTKDGYEVPVKMLLGNFTKPTKNLPSLLSMRELNTLFHEFGHIMEGMSYEGEFSTQAGSKSDFAEAMSQMFENWIGDYEILSSFAKHYKTGEVFPKELFDNMKKAKNLSSGLSAQRSLRSCLYDLNLYDKYDPKKGLDTDDLWRQLDKQMGVIPRYIEGTHPQGSWIHINTHPVYYYGYLWSEVYAQDMFTVFEKNGLLDSEAGIRYRKLILANGTQRDIIEVVEEFLGRPSNNKAYIKSLGL